MSKHLRLFIKGIGNVLEIASEFRRIYRYPYSGSDLERPRSGLDRISNDFQIAISQAPMQAGKQ